MFVCETERQRESVKHRECTRTHTQKIKLTKETDKDSKSSVVYVCMGWLQLVGSITL